MILADLKAWLKINVPADMPYWPGGGFTNRVDIRSSQRVLEMGGSPLHPGVDRGAPQGREFIVPFDGWLEWKFLPETDIGSILQLAAQGVQMELQVFHTDIPDGILRPLEYAGAVHRGEPMPMKPSNLGLSDGVHTHTEVVFPFDQELRDWFAEGAETIVGLDGKIDTRYVIAHCRRHGLNRDLVLRKIPTQVENWGCVEVTNRFMVRKWVGLDRIPVWGPGKTIHVDSKFLLDI